MAKKKDFKTWIEEQIEYYKPYLDLTLQNIDVKKDEDADYLSITCRYPYQEPRIFYTEKAEQDWKKGSLKKEQILHELLHHITDPLYYKSRKRFITDSEIEDERERLTDTLMVILNNLIK